MTRKRISIALAVLALVVLAAFAGGSHSGSAAAPATGPGNPDVYTRIAGETDCDQLKGEFDLALQNFNALEPNTTGRDIELGYLKAAGDRAKTLGCSWY